MVEIKIPKPLCGGELEQLLVNPNRGFRLETAMNVYTGLNGKYGDGIKWLDHCFEKYAQDRPLITQQYFYLTEYKDKDLDEHAFKMMKRHFDHCREKGIRILLRFAYIRDDSKWNEQDAETEQILRHIDQLQDFLYENRDILYGFQAGYLGPWGEWSGGAKQDRFTVLNHILNRIPDNLPVMVRYVWIKNVLPEFDMRRSRVAFHDDYILDCPHSCNTGALEDSPYHAQLCAESKHHTIDGEMPWAWAIKHMDGLVVARKLAHLNFTSFSIEHNYKECGGEGYEGFGGEENHGKPNLHSIEEWKTLTITEEYLKRNKMPYNPNWFVDENGCEIKRSCYEYVRDFLGYHIAVEGGRAEDKNGVTEINVSLKNYGFSAPHAMKACNIVLLDGDNNVLAKKIACKLYELQPDEKIECTAFFRGISGAKRIGVELIDYADKGARFANKCEFVNGINIIGDIV